MRTHIAFTTLLVIMAGLISCHTSERDISQVAYNYCLATAEYDLERAATFCTEETRTTTLATAARLLPKVDSAYFAADRPVDIAINQVERTSDTTAVVHYHKHTPLKDFNDTLELRLRDGHWLAHSPMVGRHRK